MERLSMSNRDIDRLKVIQSTIGKQLTWEQAGSILSLSNRQIGRLCAKVRQKGNAGIIHGLRGQQSNNSLPKGFIDKTIKIIKTHYHDFKPTFACEKLLENHSIKVSVSTLRKAMITHGIYKPKKQKPKHRKWRERRDCLGMMTQLDGSEHNWFEKRGKRCVLIIFIDDATSRILHGKFVDSEDTTNLMLCAKEYLKMHQRPVSFYVDKDSIYKINRQANVDEELRDDMPLSQFSRAMKELEIEIIFANSPQAKGRVERGFKTHQDRLVKELRLANISSIAKANDFLQNVYIPKHNGKFAVIPASDFNAHRPLLKEHKLHNILCKRTLRTLANDYTLQYKNKFIQITTQQAIRPKSIVTIEELLDGTLRLKFKGINLKFVMINKRPKITQKRQTKKTVIPYRPAKDHPWRRYANKQPVYQHH